MKRARLFLAMVPLFVAGAVHNANGGFAPKVDYAAGDAPISIFAADFNGDGKPDLAVANFYSNTVSILRNNGNGTFAAKVDYGTGNNPHSVFAADFNGDGKPDLAVANGAQGYPASDSTVSILMNNGNGTFAPKVNYTTAVVSTSVFAADFNGDGKPDLAVVSIGSDNACTSPDTVSVLKNNGDGTFAARVVYPIGCAPLSVFAADFNGDGKPDLAVVYFYSQTVSILINNGNGTFAPKVDYAAGTSLSVFAADFNGDGKLDLAVANWGSSTVSVLRNNGDGTFAARVDYPTGFGPSSVFAADLNGDGRPDLAIANGNNTVSILRNNGDGTFAAKVDYPTGAGYESSVFATDFNGDGKLDLAVANSNDNTVSILMNNGCSATKGDMNASGNMSPADVVLMLNCVFLAQGNCDFCFADVNCSGDLTPADVVLELNAVFLSTPLPC